jgi:putative nucleotidyltransferase with HDIG domain
MLFLGTALIIDNNNEIKSMIWENLYRESPDNFIFQQSTITASQIALDKKKGVSIIFVSAQLPKLNLEDFIAKLLEDTVGSIPIIVTYKRSIDPKLQTNLVAMGIAGVESLPTNPKEVKSLIKKYLEGSQEFDKVTASQEEKDKDVTLSDDLMIQVPLESFVFTPKSFFNVFIRLTKDKFIKILNAGDPITEEFINKYKEKKIKGLFLKTEEHSKYLKLSHAYAQNSILNEKKEDSEKISALSNQIEATALNMIQLGVSSENVALAKGCVENARNLINQLMMLNTKKNQTSYDLIKKFMIHDHSTSVSMLAGMLARNLDIRFPKTVQIVGLAALVHDIGLGTNLKESQKDSFSAEDNLKYMKHAKLGADYLRKSGLFEEVVCQIVEYHHDQENPNSANKKAANISIASEIVSLSDNIATKVLENPNPNKALADFRISKLKAYSIQMQKAFDEIFPETDRYQKR